MEHLIISINKNFRVQDWTPFNNEICKDNTNVDTNLNVNMNISDINLYNNDCKKSRLIYKNELINSSLNRLSNYRWRIDRTFTKGKYIYFVLIRPTIKPRPIKQNVILNLEENNKTFKPI